MHHHSRYHNQSVPGRYAAYPPTHSGVPRAASKLHVDRLCKGSRHEFRNKRLAQLASVHNSIKLRYSTRIVSRTSKPTSYPNGLLARYHLLPLTTVVARLATLLGKNTESAFYQCQLQPLLMQSFIDGFFPSYLQHQFIATFNRDRNV